MSELLSPHSVSSNYSYHIWQAAPHSHLMNSMGRLHLRWIPVGWHPQAANFGTFTIFTFKPFGLQWPNLAHNAHHKQSMNCMVLWHNIFQHSPFLCSHKNYQIWTMWWIPKKKATVLDICSNNYFLRHKLYVMPQIICHLITVGQSPPSLSPSITPSAFHSRLQTHLFHKSFPPQSSSWFLLDFLHRSWTCTTLSGHWRVFAFVYSFYFCVSGYMC